MTYSGAKDVFDTLTESRQKKQVSDVMRLAIQYARLRVDDLIATADKRMISHERSTVHNALIAACDALAQAMEEAHEDTLWREMIGRDRKDVGDFGCYVHCILGIEAR